MFNINHIIFLLFFLLIFSILVLCSRTFKITVKNQKKSGVSKYQVQYRVAGKTKWSKKTFKAKTNKVTLKKLKKGKKYEIRVRAYAKRAGYGAFGKIKKSRKVK